MAKGDYTPEEKTPVTLDAPDAVVLDDLVVIARAWHLDMRTVAWWPSGPRSPSGPQRANQDHESNCVGHVHLTSSVTSDSPCTSTFSNL